MDTTQEETELTRDQFWAMCDDQKHGDAQHTHRKRVWKHIEDNRVRWAWQIDTLTRALNFQLAYTVELREKMETEYVTIHEMNRIVAETVRTMDAERTRFEEQLAELITRAERAEKTLDEWSKIIARVCCGGYVTLVEHHKIVEEAMDPLKSAPKGVL